MMPPAETVRVCIDGHESRVDANISILEAARKLDIEIPTLCYHKDLSVVGSCRLCLVEIEGREGQYPACAESVQDGMEVFTESSDLSESRRFVLEMLLSNYLSEQLEANHSASEFLRWVRQYQAKSPPESSSPTHHPVDADSNPFIRVDLNKCILCTRCVRACAEVQGRFVLGVAERGPETRIIAGLGTDLLDARCESCGACSAYCPTEALIDRDKFESDSPDRLVRTTCGYCGVGCQFNLNVKEQRVISVTSHPDAPVNGMSLCVKGRYGYDFLHHNQRLKQPKIRRYLLDDIAFTRRPNDRGPWMEVDWETAIDLVARKLAAIKSQSGADALGFLSSAKCTNEENYLVQKLARQLIGTNNVDHCARLCHSSTVAGLGMAFGSGAMSNSMDDVVQEAKAMLIIGSNTTEQHPVFGAMIRQSVLRRKAKLIVADPRMIDMTEFATVHLRQRPGTDVALINGIMHLAIKNDWHNQDFIEQRCKGFEELKAMLEAYPPERVSQITGIPERRLCEAAEILCTNRPMAVIWAMGITQHTTGVFNVLSLANLQMLLGNMGIPGGGVNPLRGQNNVQGACDMGALPNVYPGYQPVNDEQTYKKFVEAWSLQDNGNGGEARFGLSQSSGLTVTELIEAAGENKIRGLYILGEDPAMTEPNVNHAVDCLQRAEFTVLQEIFPSETSKYADVLLPGAAFAEKNGTFTNTERRIQPVRKAIDPPGAALPDWQVLARLGTSLQRELDYYPHGTQSGWEYQDAAEVLAEINTLTPSYAGVTWNRVDAGERLQWPVLSESHDGTPILHVEKFTCGLGEFHPVEHLPPAEIPDDEYPLLLTTGRVLYHWHGGELTRRSQGLSAVYPNPIVEVSHEDARRSRIADGMTVSIQSRRGILVARAAVTDRVPEGLIFGSFHFPGLGNVNNLTISALDPVAKIPEYKVCSVRLQPYDEEQVSEADS